MKSHSVFKSHRALRWMSFQTMLALAHSLYAQDPAPVDPIVQVDVLVQYSTMTRDSAGGVEQLRKQIFEAFDLANQVYANSLVPIHLEPVGIVPYATPETGSLQVDGPNFSSAASTTRLEFRADLALLIVEEEEDEISYAAGPGVPGTKGDPGAAYIALVRNTSMRLGIGIASRTAWLMGAGSDRGEINPTRGQGSFTYSRGWAFDANGIRYVTAESNVNGLRIPYFSNPDVLFQGVPTGATDEADNASTLRTIGPLVANYQRCTNRIQFEQTVVQTQENSGTLQLRLLRTGPTNTTARIRAIAQNGSARAGTDFEFSSQTLLFAEGEMEKTIEIAILDDPLIRSTRSFRLRLDQPASGTGIGMNHEVTVIVADDETRFQFSTTSTSLREGGNETELTLQRVAGKDRAETVRLSQPLEGGGGRTLLGGVGGSKLIPLPMEVRFEAGQTEQTLRFATQDDSLEWVDGKEFVQVENDTAPAGSPLPNLEIWCRDNDRNQRFQEEFGIADDNTETTRPTLSLPDGGILLGTRSSIGSAIRLVKRRPDGSLDPEFGPVQFQETTQPDAGLAAGRILAMAMQRDGRILVGGYFASVNGLVRQGLVRLMPNGTVDPEFNPQFRGPIHALCIQADQNIIAAGEFLWINDIPQRYIARLLPNGTVDESFAPTFASDLTPVLTSVATQGDQLLVGGRFDRVNGESRSYLARLNPDGSLDLQFTSPIAGVVTGLRVLPDRSFYAFGPFRTPRPRAAKFLPNGSIDSRHRFVGLNGPVSEILPLAGGETVVCGAFGGTSTLQTGIARYRADGSADTSFGSRLRFPSPIFSIAPQPTGEFNVVGSMGFAGETSTWGLRRIAGENHAPELMLPRRELTGVRLDALTLPGLLYRLERSTDLIHWESVATHQALVSSESFTDQQGPPSAFYQLRCIKPEGEAP